MEKYPVPLLIALCLAGPVEAAERWGTVRLPGGVAAARQVIDLGRPDRPSVTFLLDLARRLHGTPIRQNPAISDRLVAFVSYLEQLRPELDQWKGGLSLGNVAADKRRREAVRDTLEALGLRLAEDDDVYRVEVGRDDDALRRVEWLRAIGCDAAAVAKALSAGESVTIDWPTDTLPLPLAYAWPTALREPGLPSLQRIVSDPRAVLFYVGLANLEPATADWLGTQPALIRRLYEDLSAPFAAFSRSLRVQDRRVRTPGGDASVALWEDLVDASASAPDDFVRRLLARDDARLAYFYDTVAMLDPARQTFLLGGPAEESAGTSGRRQIVRQIYARFASFEPTWKAFEHPLVRPDFDPGFATAVVEVGPSGVVGPAWWPDLMERVVEMSWPNRLRARAFRPGRADARWMLGWLFDTPSQARDRFALLRFAQRIFASSPESAAPEVSVALLTLRDMPPLALALERLGVRDPATYARVGMAARQLAHAGDADHVVPALRAWQGGLAVLEQVARHRALSLDVVDALVRSLADAAPPRPSTPNGAIATWVFDTLWPALAVTPPAADAAEGDAIAGIFDSRPSDDITLEWEGTAYRLDWLGPTARSAIDIREAMPGPRLPDLAILRRSAAALEGPMTSVDSVRAIAAALKHVGPALADVLDFSGNPHEAGRELADAIRTLDEIREPRSLARASRVRPAVLHALDIATAEVLAGLAHALAMAPTDAPPRVYADAARLHGYDTANPDGKWRERAWRMPELEPRAAGGSGLLGALLGIDRARPADYLRRAAREALPRRPTVSAYDHAALTGRLTLRARGTNWNDGGATVARALTRGRAMVRAWTAATEPGAVHGALEAASVDVWRAGLVWFLLSQNRGQEVEHLLTVTDLFRLGTQDTLEPAWGPAGALIDGCWCLVRPLGRPDEFWLNRRASFAATTSLDLQLRLTELLEQARLPHALLEAVLPLASEELLDQVEQITTDDRAPFAWPRSLDERQLEAYLLYLVAQEFLAPPRTPSQPR